MTAEYSTSMQEEAAKIAAIEESAPSEKVAKAAEELYDLLSRQQSARKSVQFAYDQAFKCRASVKAAEDAMVETMPDDCFQDVLYVRNVQAATLRVWMNTAERWNKKADAMGSDIRAAKAYLDVLMSQDDVTPEADDKTPLDPQERDMIDASK